MQKGKRILALIGIIVLIGIYVATFIASIFNTEFSHQLFIASLYCTFMVPLMLYAYMLIYKLVKGKKDSDSNDENQ